MKTRIVAAGRRSAVTKCAAALSFAVCACAPFALAQEREKVLSYIIVDGTSAVALETEQPGDSGRGEAVFFDPETGNCASCHWVPGMDAAPDSLAGPSLAEVGGRFASGYIRLWIINPRAIKDGAAMPAYYSLTPDEERAWGDKPERIEPILTAQEIEDLVAYLESQSSAPASAPQ